MCMCVCARGCTFTFLGVNVCLLAVQGALMVLQRKTLNCVELGVDGTCTEGLIND